MATVFKRINELFVKEEARNTGGPFRRQRLLISRIYSYLFVAFFFIAGIFAERVYYPSAHQNLADLWRLLWLAPFICGGLALRAYAMRDHPEPAKYAFGIAYPLFCIAASCIALGVLLCIESTSGWHYYLISAPIVFLLSCNPHKIFELRA